MTDRRGWRPAEDRFAARWTELVPLILVVVAEAAWISVIGGLVQEFALRDPILGIPGLAAVVAGGVILARTIGPRLGSRWPAAGFGIVVACGLAGWLSSPVARAALVEGIGPALAAHPGGWLASLAVLRGFAHARLPTADDTITNMLALGVPGMAVAAMLGGLIGEPFRTRFLDDSLVAAVLFIATAVLALAVARLDAIGGDGGFDWRRNPSWLALAVVVLAATLVAALAVAGVAGTVIPAILSIAIGPLFVLGLATGFDRAARRVLAFFAVVVLVIVVIVRVIGVSSRETPPAQGGDAAQTAPSTVEQIMSIGIGGLLVLGALAGIVVLIALWMRRSPTPEAFVRETRTIDPSEDGLAPTGPRRFFRRRPDPANAVQAYVALVADLERRGAIGRGPAETPARHAARLRSIGRADLSLDLLAADYGLARYGGVALTPIEDRRAVGRWRALRGRLVADPADGPQLARGGDAPTPDSEMPVDLEPRRTL